MDSGLELVLKSTAELSLFFALVCLQCAMVRDPQSHRKE